MTDPNRNVSSNLEAINLENKFTNCVRNLDGIILGTTGSNSLFI